MKSILKSSGENNRMTMLDSSFCIGGDRISVRLFDLNKRIIVNFGSGGYIQVKAT